MNKEKKSVEFAGETWVRPPKSVIRPKPNPYACLKLSKIYVDSIRMCGIFKDLADIGKWSQIITDAVKNGTNTYKNAYVWYMIYDLSISVVSQPQPYVFEVTDGIDTWYMICSPMVINEEGDEK